MKTETKRDRRGERPRFYLCTSVKKNKQGEPQMVQDRVYFHSEGEACLERLEVKQPGLWGSPGHGSPEEAIEIFKTAKKLAPLDVQGPLRDVLGTTNVEASRVSVTLKGSDIRWTPKRWAAKFQDFKVTANGIHACKSKDGKQEFGDNELVYLFFDEEQVVTDDSGKKKSKPRFGGQQPVIRFSALENPTEA